MNFFQNNPFTRIISFWVAGILLSKYFPPLIYLLVPCVLFFLIYSLVLYKKKRYPFDFISSLFIGSCLCLLAFLLSTPGTRESPNDHFGYYLLVLLEQPTEKPNSIQLNVRILQADTPTLEQKKAIIYTRKSEKTENLEAGDQLICKAKLHKIKNRGNPFEFDYSGYMSRQGYFYTAFLNVNDIQLLNDKKRTPVFLAENFRNKLLQILKANIESKEAFQVISALSLGYRKELSTEIKSRFAATGAMHVLAVSGLHVGMIYLLLSRLLFFLKRKNSRWTYVSLIAAMLWCYALITGFSPSVQRATVMFSFVLLGNSLKRPVSIYNSLAASAFLLLLINPDLLVEVGFQLSYMAVLSIVFFYPRLEKLIKPKYGLSKKIWQLVCVSLAAQLGTFALSIYYFNQFPVYFWLSNLLVIPVAYLILGFTFALLLFSPFQFIANVVAALLENTALKTIYLLSKIEQLPYSLIEGISISTSQLLSLIFIFISIIFFIKWKRKFYLFFSLSMLVVFLFNGLMIKYQLFNQKKIIIYNNNHLVLHLINNRKNYLLHFDDNKPNSYLFKNTVKELQLADPIPINQTDSFMENDLLIKNSFIQFIGQDLYAVDPAKASRVQKRLPTYTKIEGKRNRHTSSIFILENRPDRVLNQSHSLNKSGAFILDF